jgi:PAS domain S-box-containing protein
VENAPVGIYEIDLVSRKMSSVNDVLCSETGYSREELLSMDALDLLEGEHKTLFLDRIRKMMSGQEVTDIIEYKIKMKSGKLRWTLLNVNFTRKDGIPIRARVTATDISERKRVEEALLAYTEQLRNTNQALEDFASIASHDLQEPLRKIHAFGGLLKSKFSPELGGRGQDYIERMQQAAGRMQDMLEGLLAYARITSQGQQFAQVDLQQVVSEVLSDLEARLMETGGQVEVDPLPVIEADPLQIRQLFQNLLGNALKFHHPNVPPLVKISCSTAGENSLALAIADNGIGIEAIEAGYLFKPFSRLPGKSEFGGSGMGLAICQKIVERHGGSITVSSQPGVGTTFRVTLPIHQLK